MKIKILLVGLATLFFLYACETDDENNDETNEPSAHELPTEFPLEMGNAWIYEITHYVNGAIDSVLFDTLYIAGTYQDYFLWGTPNHYDLVKNIDNKFVKFGSISIDDTIFFDKPLLYQFYGETGCLDSTYFDGYYYVPDIDSFCISIQTREYFGEKWDTYMREVTYIDHPNKYLTYYNKLGIVSWESYLENDNMYRKHVIVEVLENVNPPKLSNDATAIRTDPILHHGYPD